MGSVTQLLLNNPPNTEQSSVTPGCALELPSQLSGRCQDTQERTQSRRALLQARRDQFAKQHLLH